MPTPTLEQLGKCLAFCGSTHPDDCPTCRRYMARLRAADLELSAGREAMALIRTLGDMTSPAGHAEAMVGIVNWLAAHPPERGGEA